MKDEGLKVMEVSGPGILTESNAKYVLTRDILAPGTGLSFARGVTNCILDLGGHTVVFNDQEPKEPIKRADAGLCGIRTAGRKIEVRNGVILQGKARSPHCAGVLVQGSEVDVHHLLIKVGGKVCDAVRARWSGSHSRIHDNYLANGSREKGAGVAAGGAGIVVVLSGTHWEINNNTIVGGHRGIHTSQCGRKSKETDSGSPRCHFKIHHNSISPKRVAGVKSPHAIYCATSSTEIYENEIQSDDGRGISVQSATCGVHHNFVDVRYSSNARKLAKRGYIENRCYAYWERGGKDCRVHENVFIVHNEVAGDASSSAIGIHAGTYNSDKNQFGVYRRNRIIAFHKDKERDALGFLFKVAMARGPIPDPVPAKGEARGNEIFAGTAAARIDWSPLGVTLEDNVCIKPERNGWKMFTGTYVGKSALKNNRAAAMPAPSKAPEAPEGLTAIRRLAAVELRWVRGADKNVIGYNIYRDGKKLNAFTNGARFYVDLTAATGGTYAYAVAAVDVANREGGKSKPLAVVLDKVEFGSARPPIRQGGK